MLTNVRAQCLSACVFLFDYFFHSSYYVVVCVCVRVIGSMSDDYSKRVKSLKVVYVYMCEGEYVRACVRAQKKQRF